MGSGGRFPGFQSWVILGTLFNVSVLRFFIGEVGMVGLFFTLRGQWKDQDGKDKTCKYLGQA